MTPGELHQGWQRRTLTGQLGVWGEHWTDVSTLPDFPAWQELARQRGRETSAEGLSYYMTRDLLPEFLYAAGGVENEYWRIIETMNEATRWAQEIPGVESHERNKTTFAAPALMPASYSFAQLLFWTRGVQDRVLRRSFDFRGDIGLLPALKPGNLKDHVATCKQEYDRAISLVRPYANYALHQGAVTGGGTPVGSMREDGSLTMLVPDPASGPANNWNKFTYSKRLDVRELSEVIMRAVHYFVDAVLDGFEEHRPARVQSLFRHRR